VPIDRSVGAAYADRIITLYVEVERELATLIAAKLKRGVAHDDLTQKMLALSEIRRSAEAAMRKIDGKTGPAVELALREAAAAGGRKAQEELLRVRDRRAVGRRLADVDKNLVNSPSILRLSASLAPALDRKLAATHLQVVRSAGDIYQHAVAAMSVPGVLAGVATRREATQKALDHLWRKGITGFVDKAGRGWNLASYVEMATRTTTSHAAIQAHLDQLGQQGMDLVMVSADGAPCPICRPWEGKILTTGSASGAQTIERASELDGSPVKVHIDGSTSEAIAAGLFHPSCRHRFITYLPGLTAPIETAGEGGALYQAEQQQRGLERQARRLAVQQAGAVDSDAAKRYAAAYRAKRAEIKAHVDDHPGLRRKTERERIDLGHTPSAAPMPPAPKLKPAPPAPKPKPAPVKSVAPRAPRRPAAQKLVPKAPANIQTKLPYAPKIDKMPRRTDRTTERKISDLVVDAVTANPGYPASRYTVNCVHVANAYELRARGLNVTATPLPSGFQNGRISQDALDRWVKRDGTPHGRKLTMMDATSMMYEAMTLPEGGRGWVAVTWETGGGHIFNVEKISGKLRFIDAQNATSDLDINSYIRRSLGAGKDPGWRFVRVDDLEPTDAVMEFITP
jgi:hypothetical protein